MAIPPPGTSTTPQKSTYENDTLKISIFERLQSLPKDDTKITIFRVPAHVREANKLLYEPRMVSIGPYYRGREELRPMEQLKLRYLRDLLGRGTGEQIHPLSSYVRAVREVEERARRSYYEQTKLFGIKNNEASVQSVPDSAEPSEQAQSDGFAEMLLLDGCFILELMFKWFEDTDLLQSIGWGVDLVNSDLLLLENQIPFFVLVSLYTVFIGSGIPIPRMINKKLVECLYTFLNDEAFSRKIPSEIFTVEIHHLLHLYYEAFLPKPEPRDIQAGDDSPSEQDPKEEQESGGNSAEPLGQSYFCSFFINIKGKVFALFQKKKKARSYSNTVIPCTTQLREAGVRFKTKEKPKHMLDITFSNSVMEIPTFVIEYATTPLLVNLIALEQIMARKKGVAAPLTSYTALMTALVRTGKDVEVLEKHDIIKNLLSSEDDAAKSYFNHLGTCCTLDYNKHYFASEFVELNKYYDSDWNKYKAKFRRDYCANPWTIGAFVVAVLAFLFGLSQWFINLSHLPQRPH